jgi:hypothetical protein
MAVRGLLLTAFLALLAGCGGGAAAGAGMDPSRTAFRLNVWEESLVGGAQAAGFTYYVAYPNAEWCTVDVQVIGAVSLKALYFDLRYDAQRLEPVGVDFNNNIAPEALRLEQISLSEPGRVVASETPNGVLATGFTGSGKLARVLFRRK